MSIWWTCPARQAMRSNDNLGVRLSPAGRGPCSLKAAAGSAARHATGAGRQKQPAAVAGRSASPSLQTFWAGPLPFSRTSGGWRRGTACSLGTTFTFMSPFSPPFTGLGAGEGVLHPHPHVPQHLQLPGAHPGRLAGGLRWVLQESERVGGWVSGWVSERASE